MYLLPFDSDKNQLFISKPYLRHSKLGFYNIINEFVNDIGF